MSISPSPNTPSTLVGRDRELRVLRDHLDAAIGGHGGLVLIGGEAGIGKTALAEAACGEAAERGARVLIGRCYDLTETPPYGPWVELFGRYRPTDGDPSLPAAFAERGTVGAVASQSLLFRQVEDFVAALATSRPEGIRPVVLFLDDLHWADPASLDLLRFLARQVAHVPILILVTYRTDELTRRHSLYALLPLLNREAGATRIDPKPLAADDVRALIHARYGLADMEAAPLIAYLVERSEGNAFFIGELLRALEEEGVLRVTGERWSLGDLAHTRVPALLRQVIDGRLERLGAEAQRLLAIAAVIGHEVPLALWAAVADTEEEALLGVLERAGEAHLIAESSDGTRARFVHALIREALYEGFSPARRRLIHRKAGEVLMATQAPDADAVAAHLQQAGDGRAVAWLVRAGERAQLAYAWLTAIERYEAARALLENGDEDMAQQGWLRYRIARLRRYTTPAQGIEYLDEALRIAALVGDSALAAAARYTRGLCLFYLSDYAGSIRDMAAGCDALESLSPGEQGRLDLGPDEHGTPIATNPRGLLVVALATSGHIAEAIAMGEATREGMPRHTSLGELGWAHHGDRHGGLGEAYACAGRPDAADAAFERARDIFRALGNHSTLGAITVQYMRHVSLPYRTERLDEHWRLAAEAIAAWERASASAEYGTRFVRTPVLALTGQWAEARREAESQLRARLTPVWREFSPLMLGVLARQQGESEEAWGYVRAALPEGPRTVPGTRTLLGSLAMMRLAAALLLDAADPARAHEWLLAHDRWLAWSGAVLGQSEGQVLWGEHYRAAGDTANARAHTERALTHASDPRQPLALLAVHRLLGELDTEARRFDNAASHLDASLRLADACHAPYERALTLLALAALQLAGADTEGARTLLDEARVLCEPLGAKPALARAAALAARLDAAKQSAPAYPAGLSAREADVLRLVAEGLSNPQIGGRLFVSPRTVEQHLRSIFNKTGVPSRAAAARWAAEHGLA